MRPISFRSLGVALAFLVALLVYFIWFLRQEGKPGAEVPAPVPVSGPEETCLNCHQGMSGFEPAHQPGRIGCTPCHGGNPTEQRAGKAHEGMILIPGNMSDARQTCGRAGCHPDMVHRVENSLMTTMAGVIAVDKFAFGESASLSGDFHVRKLGILEPSDLHLRQLCASCHLGNPKEALGPIQELSRGGGCNACHLNYSQAARESLSTYQKKGKTPGVHPALTVQVSNDHCFGCHSRSGRISTNYEGWHETSLQPEEVAGKPGFRLLDDGRVFRFVAPDVHHTAGLECIDCHHASEIMGDGTRHLHEEDAVKVRCEDCHFAGKAKGIPLDSLDQDSKRILALRPGMKSGSLFLRGNASGLNYYHISVDTNGLAHFLTKNSLQAKQLNAPAAVCSREGGHRDVTCTACHTAWAPQCIGCHNAFEPQTQAYDLLFKKPVQGKWREYLGEFFADPPSLGVVHLDSGKIREIQAFIPGMTLTIDRSAFPGPKRSPAELFHRLFAPVSAHTISATGRSCQSCHNDPVALGYGRGNLTLEVKGQTGRWAFYPAYALEPQDKLPQDAWIGFLKEPSGKTPATRDNARPFTIAEQQRILEVGTCLTCHNGNSDVMLAGLKDFAKTKKRMTPSCVRTTWK
ncbi:MAG: hypothetical protein IPK21_25035 [Haliscomenobacter sp.]|nr:hypothetical protein [Haliscomenobacter sp.]